MSTVLGATAFDVCACWSSIWTFSGSKDRCTNFDPCAMQYVPKWQRTLEIQFLFSHSWPRPSSATVGLPLASIVFWIFSHKSCTHRWLLHARFACDSSMPTALVWPYGRFCTFVVSRCAFSRVCSGCPCSSTIYHSVCIERVALPSLDGTPCDPGNLPLTWIFSHKCHKYALRRVRAPSKCAFSMFVPI